jgi:hypothetical protein
MDFIMYACEIAAEVSIVFMIHNVVMIILQQKMIPRKLRYFSFVWPFVQTESTSGSLSSPHSLPSIGGGSIRP